MRRSGRFQATPTGYFNPRTHVGCDHKHPRSCRRENISIHAPTWGATGGQMTALAWDSKISIHAPTWGATQSANIYILPLLFQSTHPRGVRRHLEWFGVPSMEFQSTHPRGVRHRLSVNRLELQQFQSTHPRGVRLYKVGLPTSSTIFQSTHPRGVRRHLEWFGVPSMEFQSTHPRGVRRSARRSGGSIKNFNPRTHVGCDMEGGT